MRSLGNGRRRLEEKENKKQNFARRQVVEREQSSLKVPHGDERRAGGPETSKGGGSQGSTPGKQDSFPMPFLARSPRGKAYGSKES